MVYILYQWSSVVYYRCTLGVGFRLGAVLSRLRLPDTHRSRVASYIRDLVCYRDYRLVDFIPAEMGGTLGTFPGLAMLESDLPPNHKDRTSRNYSS
jgi:hypothetical protein